ncbi:MAG TPA: hypothetical protein VNO14_16340 [Blastocatellia bacterium]|nr:hypothetical protein [Blastocatellia bacterium]
MDRPASLWQRIKVPIIGSILVLILGFILVNIFTYVQYGGTLLDSMFEREQSASPDAGKFAYDKGTKYYIGIIRGEGNSPGKGKVYYIEQPGGVIIDVSKSRIEVREPK